MSSSPWCKDIFSYLQTLQRPSNLTSTKYRLIKLQAIKYRIISENIYWKDPLGFLLNFPVESETENWIDEFHKWICGGHHAWRATTYKILRDKYYWPKLFSNVNEKVRSCRECPFFAGKQYLPSLPLVPVKAKAHFQ